MAYDFPTSPTDGQVSGPYYWSASKGAWRVTPTTVAKTIMSPTAPTGASEGDQWQNTNDGSLFIRWNDGTSTQWVESRAPITADGYTSPNYLINGGMDIWQRGTSFTTANGVGYFAADRWGIYSNPGRTWSRVSAGLAGFTYAFRVQRNSGNTDTYSTTILQMIESANMAPLAGKNVTLSFYARKGADYSTANSKLFGYVNTGTGIDQNILTGYTGNATPIDSSVTLTSSWQRFSFTGQIASNATEMMVGFYGVPVGTAGANDYYEITGIQLEEGTAPTAFRRNANSIQGELAACQRYYYRNTGSSSEVRLAFGMQFTATNAEAIINVPVELRTTPTIGYSNCYWTDGVAFNQAVTSMNARVSPNTTKAPTINVGFASAGSARWPGFISVSSAGGYVELSAEL